MIKYMIEEIFRNIAHLFYPKGICFDKEQLLYIKSEEYKRLLSILKTHENAISTEVERVVSELKKNLSLKELHIIDITNLHFHDRSTSIQVIKFDYLHNKQFSICLNTSLLIPFYTIYVLEVAVDFKLKKWNSAPFRSREAENIIFSKEIYAIKAIIENVGYSQFPESILYNKIKNISFQDIKLGEATFFNAFFLNNYFTRL